MQELCGTSRLGPISFTARQGEIVGFASQEKADVDELFRLLFGLNPVTSGQILVRDRPYRPTTPLAAIRCGWALIPESRREQGLMMDWSISRNTALLVLDTLLSRLKLIDHQKVRLATDQSIQKLGIVTDSPEKKVGTLSGGNQQKVLLAKWLVVGPAILILNNPTRGVDVGAKWEIYELCQQLAAKGMTILMTSGEVDEVLGLADRVIVLSKGRTHHDFQRGDVTQAELMHAMASTAPTELGVHSESIDR